MQLSGYELCVVILGYEVDDAHGSGVVGGLQYPQGPQAVGTCLQGKSPPRLHLHHAAHFLHMHSIYPCISQSINQWINPCNQFVYESLASLFNIVLLLHMSYSPKQWQLHPATLYPVNRHLQESEHKAHIHSHQMVT